MGVLAVWCLTFTQDLIDSNFTNTCPRDMKLNQSVEDMLLHLVIQFGGKAVMVSAVIWTYYLKNPIRSVYTIRGCVLLLNTV